MSTPKRKREVSDAGSGAAAGGKKKVKSEPNPEDDEPKVRRVSIYLCLSILLPSSVH